MPRLMPPQSTRLIENVTIEWGKKKKYKAIFPFPFFFFREGRGSMLFVSRHVALTALTT